MANKIITTILNKVPEAVIAGLTIAVAYWNLDRRLREIKEDTEYILKWK